MGEVGCVIIVEGRVVIWGDRGFVCVCYFWGIGKCVNCCVCVDMYVYFSMYCKVCKFLYCVCVVCIDIMFMMLDNVLFCNELKIFYVWVVY